MEMLNIVLRSLAVKGDARISEGMSSLQWSISTNILIRSNYTRTSHVRDLFAFYLMPNDHINNYF